MTTVAVPDFQHRTVLLDEAVDALVKETLLLPDRTTVAFASVPFSQVRCSV